MLSESVVNELLQKALGNVLAKVAETSGIPGNFNCAKTNVRIDLGSVAKLPGNKCQFYSTDEERKDWYGTYSSWRISNGSSEDQDQNFDSAFEPLQPSQGNSSDPNVLWFSGSAYCDCHSEFAHGGYWSGGLAMNELLVADGYVVYRDDGSPVRRIGKTDEYQKCFESC